MKVIESMISILKRDFNTVLCIFTKSHCWNDQRIRGVVCVDNAFQDWVFKLPRSDDLFSEIRIDKLCITHVKLPIDWIWGNIVYRIYSDHRYCDRIREAFSEVWWVKGPKRTYYYIWVWYELYLWPGACFGRYLCVIYRREVHIICYTLIKAEVCKHWSLYKSRIDLSVSPEPDFLYVPHWSPYSNILQPQPDCTTDQIMSITHVNLIIIKRHVLRDILVVDLSLIYDIIHVKMSKDLARVLAACQMCPTIWICIELCSHCVVLEADHCSIITYWITCDETCYWIVIDTKELFLRLIRP